MNNKIINNEPIKIQIKIFIVPLLLTFFSLMIFFEQYNGQLSNSIFLKHLYWFLVGLTCYVLVQKIQMQFFLDYAYHLYLLLVVLLVSVFLFPSINGSHRWIDLIFFKFQPSEIGKIIIVFVLARFLSDIRGKLSILTIIALSSLFILLTTLLIFSQPDLGTSIVYLGIFFPMLYMSGIQTFYLLIIIAPLISLIASFHLLYFFIWMFTLLIFLIISRVNNRFIVFLLLINIIFSISSSYIWKNILYPHQRNRILTFFDPFLDPQGSGYQIIQSMVAIGSGSLFGKGLGEGTQTQLRYLPVKDTDFIISVVGEEFGFLGILLVVSAFIYFLFIIVDYANKPRNFFNKLVIIGFSSIYFNHISINFLMVSGYFPVTGLPVPFLSYGGSFLITCFIIAGLVNNIVSNEI